MLLQRNEIAVAEGLWVAMVIWRVPAAVRGSNHSYKYRLALIDRDRCVLRYDNEAGRGDHKHIREIERGYVFSSLDQLIEDFWNDVAAYAEGDAR